MLKQETLPKGVEATKLTSPKHLVIHFFFMRNVLITSILDNKVKVFKSPKS